jgi:pimeloyl-ACP methyl ester carboxylesterase
LDIWTKQFEAATDGSAAAEIKARALHLATQTNHEICTAWQDANTRGSHTLIVGGEETSPERVRRSGEGSPNRFSSDVRKSLDFRKSLASVRKKHYEASSSVPQDGQASNRAKARPDPLPELKLHVGYLLVSPLLPPISAFTTLPFGLNALKANSEDILQKLAANPSLAVFGSDDMFTSARKLRGWAQDISIKPSSRFQFVEVDGAGHFWRSISAQKSLRIAVTEWIQGLSSGTPKTAGT